MDSSSATKRAPLTRSKTATSVQAIEIKEGNGQRPNSPQVGPKNSQPSTNITTDDCSQKKVFNLHNQDQDKSNTTVTSDNYEQCFKEAFTSLTTILKQQVKSAEVRGRISEQMRIILTVYDKLTLIIEHSNHTNQALQKQIQDSNATSQQVNSTALLEDRIIQNVNQQFDQLKQSIIHLSDSSNARNQSTPLSYAQAAKREQKSIVNSSYVNNKTKNILTISAKDPRKSTNVKQEVKLLLTPLLNQIRINKMVSLSNAKLLLECDSKLICEKIKQHINNNHADAFDARFENKKYPTIKMLNLEPDIKHEQIIDGVIQQNKQLFGNL